MKRALVFAAFSMCFTRMIYAKNLELLLLHTNDMHSKFEEVTSLANSCNELEKNRTCVGGFARLAHEIRRYRKWGEENSKSVLFMNAGDTFVGSDWYSVHKWEICSKFLNLLEPDVVTLGNHEFDDGIEVLKKFASSLNCPIVCSNLNNSIIPPVTKSVVLEVQGRKIGIIGFVTQETAFLSNIENIEIGDEITAVKAESERLNEEGVNIIIGLGHSGINIEKKLAEEVPLLDVVIGGHSNTFLWNGPKPHKEDIQGPYPEVVTQKSGKKVPVVQAYAYTLYLGRLNVTFDENGDLIDFSGQPEYLESSIPQDQDILDVLETYRPGVTAVNQEMVGKSSVYLDGMCRMHECNFGNLVTDAMVFYAAYHNDAESTAWSRVAIAFYNAGNMRNSINVTYTKGNITKGELLAALPFENKIVSVELKGSILKEVLEHTVNNYENNFISAQFLQVSGLRVEFDLSRSKGDRVVSVRVRCWNCSIPTYKPLDLNENYAALTTDFVLNGGDGFSMIKENAKNVKEFGISLFDLILWYLKLQSPVYPEVQGRIRFVHSVNSSANISSQIWTALLPILLCVVVSH